MAYANYEPGTSPDGVVPEVYNVPNDGILISKMNGGVSVHRPTLCCSSTDHMHSCMFRTHPNDDVMCGMHFAESSSVCICSTYTKYHADCNSSVATFAPCTRAVVTHSVLTADYAHTEHMYSFESDSHGHPRTRASSRPQLARQIRSRPALASGHVQQRAWVGYTLHMLRPC